MMQRIAGWCLSSVLLASVLVGCSIVQPPNRPAWRTFLLEPARTGGSVPSTGSPGGAGVLRVAVVSSVGGAETPRMTYIARPGEQEYFAKHRWAEAPSMMLTPFLIEALSASGRYAGVIGPDSRAEENLLLELEWLAFRQEFFEGGPRFRATLRASVVRANDSELAVAPQTFQIVEPCAAATPEAGVEAAERAAGKIAAAVAAYAPPVEPTSH